MTPKEKAKELVDKYESKCKVSKCINQDNSEFILPQMKKECAIILVEEILTNNKVWLDSDSFYYWQQVKTEIQAL